MRRHRALAALAACCLAACRPEAPAPTPLPDGISAPETEAGNEFLAALLESASDRSVTGAAVLTSDDGKLVLAVALDGLAPGSYTVHVHEYDDCRRPGPRFSLPGDVEFSPDGRSVAGTFGDFEVGAARQAKVSIVKATPVGPAVFADRAVVIRAGGEGGVLACGVLRPVAR